MASVVMREVPWGKALSIETKGKLNGAVDRIHVAVGDWIGVRNTFAALHALTAPPEDADDRFRLWLVVVACGLDENEWEVTSDDVPPAYDEQRLRDLLTSHSPCTTTWPPGPLNYLLAA